MKQNEITRQLSALTSEVSLLRAKVEELYRLLYADGEFRFDEKKPKKDEFWTVTPTATIGFVDALLDHLKMKIIFRDGKYVLEKRN
jgi:hypothetical protein